jgi:uncharacterized phage-like protein YoqJ
LEAEIIQQARNAASGRKLYVVNNAGKICCFTGHRPNKFSFGYNEQHSGCVMFKALLKAQLVQAIRDGYYYFISGGALGVDQWAAEIIIELKTEYPYIRLELAVPCRGQDSKWPGPSKERYRRILTQADVIAYVSLEDYRPDLMLKRDDYMIEKSNRLIAVYNGDPGGGTAHTYRKGKEKGLEIVRINPNTFEVASEGGWLDKQKNWSAPRRETHGSLHFSQW